MILFNDEYILAMNNVNVHIIKLEYVNTYTINMDEIKL